MLTMARAANAPAANPNNADKTDKDRPSQLLGYGFTDPYICNQRDEQGSGSSEQEGFRELQVGDCIEKTIHCSKPRYATQQMESKISCFDPLKRLTISDPGQDE